MKYKKISLKINKESAGQRLDKALCELEEISSRSQAAKLFDQKLISLNSKLVKPSYITEEEEVFEIQIPESSEINLKPFPFDLDILYEDEDLLVIHKPAGIVMHPSLGHEEKSIVNALIHMKISLSMGFSEHRPGIVHRLDKGTSGLVVIAKNNESHAHLSAQFQNRTVTRSYWAIVWGLPNKKTNTIETTLQRHLKNRKKYASIKEASQDEINNPINKKDIGGKKAITHYSLLETHLNKISLVKCKLDTGRTHQIRVHMSELHHPIVGDTLYGNDKRSVKISKALLSEIQNLDRLALHAFELGFKHPKHGEEIYFTQSWPKDLLPLVQFLDLDTR